MKVVRLSALRTGRLYPLGNIPGTRFCWRLSRPQGHSEIAVTVSLTKDVCFIFLYNLPFRRYAFW